MVSPHESFLICRPSRNGAGLANCYSVVICPESLSLITKFSTQTPKQNIVAVKLSDLQLWLFINLRPSQGSGHCLCGYSKGVQWSSSLLFHSQNHTTRHSWYIENWLSMITKVGQQWRSFTGLCSRLDCRCSWHASHHDDSEIGNSVLLWNW